ncbi:hypothetical protein DFH06DRAFT_1354455 [Mycena polygramma]|nr:hypothetical protein DFH06DRAFT_1354455 [Mycena polygramma]
MPPRAPRDPDSAVHYEPLRASVLDVFEQLGAFDDHSGIVEWIFPEFHEENQAQRSRVKLTENFDSPDPVEPETPQKSRTSRFFRLGTKSTKSRSKSRSKKDAGASPATTAPPKQKPKELKKTKSSPDLRKKSSDSKPPETPTGALTPSAEQKSNLSKRLSIFPRKGTGQSLDQPRPSISDEEWQQVTMTGSIADYAVNPFLGTDPHGENTNTNDAGQVKQRDGTPKKHFSRLRFTSGFARSTPTTPTREHAPAAPTTPTAEPSPPAPTSPPASPPAPAADGAASDPTTPTAASPRITSQSNASTSTLTAAPASPDIQEVPREDVLETSSQMDHVRQSLSDISEGDVSESSTLSIKSSRKSDDSATVEASP